MRRTSVRELHIRTSEFVRQASEGSVIVIESRGKPVAELRPISLPPGPAPEVKKAIVASMKDLWEQLPATPDSTLAIEEDRDR